MNTSINLNKLGRKKNNQFKQEILQHIKLTWTTKSNFFLKTDKEKN
jgi:hypothetical protein